MMTPTIRQHGRAAFILKVSFRDEFTGALVDLSTKNLAFEMEGGLFRTSLGYDADPTVRTVKFNRDTVAQFPTETTAWIIVDETIPGEEVPLGEGKVKRVGW